MNPQDNNLYAATSLHCYLTHKFDVFFSENRTGTLISSQEKKQDRSRPHVRPNSTD